MFKSTKDERFAPVIVTVFVSGAAPVLVRVKVLWPAGDVVPSGRLPKSWVAGIRVAAVVSAAPDAAPDRETVCMLMELFSELSVTTREPVFVPELRGSKSTAKAQLAPGFILTSELPAGSSGHVEELSRYHEGDIAGFEPASIGLISRKSLPMFCSAAVSGESLVSRVSTGVVVG
jgi:hypothetical protein